MAGPELWLARPGRPPVRFGFHDDLRPDAVEVVAGLRRRGLAVELLSGDRLPTVAAVADTLGLTSSERRRVGKGVSGRVELGGRRHCKKNKTDNKETKNHH